METIEIINAAEARQLAHVCCTELPEETMLYAHVVSKVIREAAERGKTEDSVFICENKDTATDVVNILKDNGFIVNDFHYSELTYGYHCVVSW